MVESYLNKIVRFGSVCGLYFINQTKPYYVNIFDIFLEIAQIPQLNKGLSDIESDQ